MTSPPNFDRIARAYRWLEYLTLGHTLELCRFHFLPQLSTRTHALILGDGDGRFTARLLQQNPTLTADAVDLSAAMLTLLRDLCERESTTTSTRLRTHHTDAIAFVTAPARDTHYDLVVTHFFLDCLTQPDLDILTIAIRRLSSTSKPTGTLWLVSDFRIPTGPMRLPARIFVRSLYLAFRLLTGLRPTHLPDHHAALHRAGFKLVSEHLSFFKILTTQLWSID